MFILYAEKNKLTVRTRETVTSGSVNTYTVRFEFSEDWEGMTRVAVFRSGSQAVSVLLDETCECVIPWEVTDPDDSRKRLYAGVYGTRDGGVVLPTIWADLGEIQPGVSCCCSAGRPPTPDIQDQILSKLENKQDKLRGLPGQVVGFDESGSAVPMDMPSGGGREGGATDHRLLTDRDAPDQHSIESITGLQEALAKIPRPMTADELQKILMN